MNRLQMGWVGALLAVGLGVAAVTRVSAQQTPPPPPAGPQGFGFQAIPRQNIQPGLFMGQVQVVNDPSTLYVVRGNQVVRISKDTMKVSGIAVLPPESPMGGRFGGGPGAPARPPSNNN